MNDLKNVLERLDEIENLRKKNNINWMNLVKLAFRSSPEEAKKIFSDITKEDREINKVCCEISKEKE